MSFNQYHSYFTKENLDSYLKELAKEFRKKNGKKVPAEIILIGSAAILVNYGFRDSTTDIDAIIHASSAMKEAINLVGDRYQLPNNWLNSDFIRTSSYSPQLIEVSKYYRTYSNIVEIRTIDAQYLIAMKLKSGRKYKSDLSDIVGILKEHDMNNRTLFIEDIQKAVNKLYKSWDSLSHDAQNFIEDIMKDKKYNDIFEEIQNEENLNHEIIVNFDKKYPKALKESNLDDILSQLKKVKSD